MAFPSSATHIQDELCEGGWVVESSIGTVCNGAHSFVVSTLC